MSARPAAIEDATRRWALQAVRSRECGWLRAELTERLVEQPAGFEPGSRFTRRTPSSERRRRESAPSWRTWKRRRGPRARRQSRRSRVPPDAAAARRRAGGRLLRAPCGLEQAAAGRVVARPPQKAGRRAVAFERPGQEGESGVAAGNGQGGAERGHRLVGVMNQRARPACRSHGLWRA